MLLKKLARAIACKYSENPSKLYELQLHADEQTREILRLNHVLDEIKKEREDARAAVVSWQEKCNGREVELKAVEKMIDYITEKNCGNCGKKCSVKPKKGEGWRYNCYLWEPKEEEHEDHA